MHPALSNEASQGDYLKQPRRLCLEAQACCSELE
jgi:hypothetical protein